VDHHEVVHHPAILDQNTTRMKPELNVGKSDNLVFTVYQEKYEFHQNIYNLE